MSDTIFTEKRTRSQLTLPDDILHLSQRSPLKDARTALRNNISTLDISQPSLDATPIEEIDDILPSSPVASVATKRSASPRDEYSSRADLASSGRELKRLKRDANPIENIEVTNSIALQAIAPTHSRSLSQPTRLGLTTHGNFAATASSNEPASLSSAHLPVTNRKERAQSAPLFPSSSMVYIDLRNPPLSPRRARSRSPSKDKDLIMRVMTESSDNKIHPPLIESIAQLPRVAAAASIPNITHTVASLSELDAVTNTSSITTLPELPSTPTVTQHPFTTISLSPLTPLPDTPHWSKISTGMEDQRAGIRWGKDLDESDDGDEMNCVPPLLTTSKSRLPRPSNVAGTLPTPSSSSLTTGSKNSTVLAATSIPEKQLPNRPIKLSTTSRYVKEPVVNDAFEILMGRTHMPKEADKSKGKGKERSFAKRNISSTTKLALGGPSTSQSQQFKVKGKDKGKESQPKVSLKAKMRPKEIPKAKPLLMPIPASADEVGERSHSPVPQTPSQSHWPTVSDRVDTLSPIALDTLHNTIHPNKFNVKQPTSEVCQSHSTGAEGNAVSSMPVPTYNNTPDDNLGHQSLFVPAASKLPRMKRVKTVSPKVDRVTRSVSSRQREKEAIISEKSAYNPRQEIPAQMFPQDSATSTSGISAVSDSSTLDGIIPPGSPMKLSSPIRNPSIVQTSIPAKPITKPTPTPSKPKILSKSASPSPTKLVRSASMFSMPTSSKHILPTGGQSSLSTLANALEKLRMPPPARPNTSMGFNSTVDNGAQNSPKAHIQTIDDISIGRPSQGGHKKITTTGAKVLPGVFDGKTRYEPPIATKAKLLGSEQKPSTSFFSRGIYGTTRIHAGAGSIMRNDKSHIFGSNKTGFGRIGRGGSSQKASRKTSLPSVMASPVKGANTVEVADNAPDNTDYDIIEGHEHTSGNSVSVNVASASDSTLPSGKESAQHITSRKDFASRRVSLASQALSQSLSSLPLPREAGLNSMGPPATPTRRTSTRSASSSYPSTADKSPGEETTSQIKVMNAVGPKIAPGAGHILPGKKLLEGTRSTSSKPIPDSLKILNDCIIFVDVRTDDGDEAGSLFVEMLEGVGARVLTRVGQTCTHIVYKNGLVSTSTRYRLLRDPKPFVVGIAWVVECVEQRKRVDESKFAIDLDGINVAGINKRRRSMLPKSIICETGTTDPRSSDTERGREVGDEDQSSTSITLDDNLTPLEKARQRKGAL